MKEGITKDLHSVFSYVFIETASYYFVVPKQPNYTAIYMEEKLYQCDGCGKTVSVKLKQNGQIYMNRKLLEMQKHEYRKDQLSFPQIENGEPLVYRRHGYCCDCAEKYLQETEELGQDIYNRCAQLLKLDASFPFKGQQKADEIIKKQISSLHCLEELENLDVTDYLSMHQWICNVLAKPMQAWIALLEKYKKQSVQQIQEIAILLDRLRTERFSAYVDCPTTVYETLDDGIYNEYTVIFPDEKTTPQNFYILKDVDLARVELFLRQQRITDFPTFLAEVPFDGRWVEFLLHKEKKLKNLG